MVFKVGDSAEGMVPESPRLVFGSKQASLGVESILEAKRTPPVKFSEQWQALVAIKASVGKGDSERRARPALPHRVMAALRATHIC